MVIELSTDEEEPASDGELLADEGGWDEREVSDDEGSGGEEESDDEGDSDTGESSDGDEAMGDVDAAAAPRGSGEQRRRQTKTRSKKGGNEHRMDRNRKGNRPL